VRDHLLGFAAVSGRGEEFKSGSRVMKNVTGYDLSKLMAGSWGTLAVLAQATFKVLPAPETEATVMLAGLADEAAARAMSAAMQSAADVSGAAHLPADVAADGPVTLLRLEGVGPSVEFRAERLHEILSEFGRPNAWTRPRRGRCGRGARRALSRRRTGPAGVAHFGAADEGPARARVVCARPARRAASTTGPAA
jgi:FAD/FMN-containing dehydrogenase